MGHLPKLFWGFQLHKQFHTLSHLDYAHIGIAKIAELVD